MNLKWQRNVYRASAAILFGISTFNWLAPFSTAQVIDQSWNVAGPADWNDDANWDDGAGGGLVPDATFGEGALIGNAGAAFIAGSVPDVARLQITNGELEIRAGGTLNVLESQFEPQAGDANVQGSGVLRLLGNGSLNVGRDLSNEGLIELPSPTSTLSVGGNYSQTSSGILQIPIVNNDNAMIDVTGNANLGGTLHLDTGGQALSFGDSFDIINAGMVQGGFSNVELAPGTPSLGRGLVLASTASNGTASVAVENRAILRVDRDTGKTEIQNVVGDAFEITGYTIGSQLGLLEPTGWTSLESAGVAGWREANPQSQFLSEVNLTESSNLTVGTTIDLGNAYNGGATRPADEDVTFQYLTIDGNIINGLVEYTGPANDLVLKINPETGESAIQNLSRFTGPFDIVGYSILSESGALSVDNWSSFADSGAAGSGWEEANPKAAALAELNLDGSHVFGNRSRVDIGDAFVPGSAQDLIFQYATLAGDVLFGTVEYGDLEPLSQFLESDFNKDGNVDLQDFNILKANFGSGGTMDTGDANMDGNVDLQDFNILKGQFGQSASAAVPEPATFALAFMGLAALVCMARKRR